MPHYQHEGIEARFADQLPGISVSCLLSNQGTFHVKVLSPTIEGELFCFMSPDYRMRLAVHNGTVEFWRNTFVARKRIGTYQRYFQILASWSPTRFQLALMFDGDVGGDDACVTRETDPIFISLPLLKWARNLNLLPQTSYNSVPEFLGTFMEALRQAGMKIRDTNSYNLFWDRQRKQGSNPRRVPKLEPEAMAGLAAFLQDQSVLKGFELVRESTAGPGALDLYVLAPLSSGGMVRLCVEGKTAHSPDLMHGLIDQLPAYMKHKQADYGIYLVLWYKCDDFPYPNEEAIDITLPLTQGKTLPNIGIEKVDLSIPVSPSDPEFKFG